MQNVYEQFQEMGQTSYAALQEIASVNSDALQKLSELQMKFATESIESGIDQVKALSNSTSYKDLFKSASEFTSDYSSKLVDVTKKTTQVLSSAQNDVIAAIEKGFVAAGKTSKPATKRVAKKEAE